MMDDICPDCDGLIDPYGQHRERCVPKLGAEERRRQKQQADLEDLQAYLAAPVKPPRPAFWARILAFFFLLGAACGPVPLVCDRADVGATVTATSDATGKPETFVCVQTTSGAFAWQVTERGPK